MQSQMYVPPLSKYNKIIIIVYIGLFLLNSVLLSTANINLVNILGLSYQGVSKGLIYQIVTFPFIETNFMSALFNALILWFVGSELEQNWGGKFYLKFLAIVGFIPAMVVLILSFFLGGSLILIPLHGLHGINLALLVAYGIIYSERMMLFMLIFPMKARYFTIILAAVEIFMAFNSSASNGVWVHVMSMGIGYLYLLHKSSAARGLSLWQVYKNKKYKHKRSKLTIVKDERDKADPEDPKYWQ